MRINKFIANSGYCSRRKADELIDQGKVFVNGKLLKESGLDVSESDKVEVMGKVLTFKKKFYYKLNKPVGYISSNFDPHNSKDLNELVDINDRFFTAGRLDKNSRGLMLITNDGDVVNNLIHPRYKVEKSYEVKVSKLLNSKEKEKFQKELDLGDNEISREAKLELINDKEKKYEVKICQGYKRQIRRMFKIFGAEVLDLKRTKIGEISLGNLDEGKFVRLSQNEMTYLFSLS